MNRVACAVVLLLSALATSAAEKPVRLLFLGNSITYVGNLPAVFSALCAAEHHACATELIAAGGGTLSQRVEDRSLARLADTGRFDYLVMQERGGDLIAPASQGNAAGRAVNAAVALARDANGRGMKTILLGTYQPDPQASLALEFAEAQLANRIGALHVPVSRKLNCARMARATAQWLNKDGIHPGPDLTLLMAVQMYRELFRHWPPATRLEVRAPIYGLAPGLNTAAFAGAQMPPEGTPASTTYGVASMKTVIEILAAPCG